MPRLCPPRFPLLPLVVIHHVSMYTNLSCHHRLAIPHLPASFLFNKQKHEDIMQHMRTAQQIFDHMKVTNRKQTTIKYK